MTAVLEPATPARRVAPDGTASARARSGRTPGLRSTPAQQRRIPWIALGLLLVFGAGLAFAAWSRSASSRVPVLVAAADVAAGETVQPEALATAEVNVGAGVRTIPASERGRLTGQVARGPIPAGTLITPEMLTDGSAVPAGQAVVGAVLAPGAYPTASLRAGDAVLLMEASSATDQVSGRSRTRVRSGLGGQHAGRPGRLGLVRVAAGPGRPGGGSIQRRGAPAAPTGARGRWIVIWAVTGGKGAPGATTLTAMLARLWPAGGSDRLIIEADPEGGVLAARWHDAAGLTHEPGLLSLAAGRGGPVEERLRRHAQVVTEGVALVAGPSGPAQAEACLRALGEAAADAVADASVACFVDCGRLHPTSPALPWARRAVGTLFVMRPRLDEVSALRPVADRLRDAGVAALGLVCVGHRPFHPLEVAEHAGLPLRGVVAEDPAAAASIFSGGLDGRGLARTRLARSVADLARSLAGPTPVRDDALADEAGALGTAAGALT